MILTKPNISPVSLKSLALLIVTIVSACLFYKILDTQSLKHSAVLFLGIPVFMSVALAASCNIKHITLNVMAGLSLGLVASFIYLDEGSFCVPMTAPLFLFSGLIISACFIKLRQSNYTHKLYFLPVLFLAFLSVEGLSKQSTFPRLQSANTFMDTSMSAAQIELALAQNKSFANLPFLLRHGFPQPSHVSNQGNNIGDMRSVYFSGGEGEPGTAEFKITKRTKNSIEYTLIKDTTHISHWLNWKVSTVSWHEIKPGLSRVNWTIEYERKLDPVWYFSPLQNYSAKLASKTLIDNLIL